MHAVQSGVGSGRALVDRRRLLVVVAAVIAALGVALVFVYARGAESRAAEQFDAVEVLVAKKKIDPGESVDDALANGKIALEPVARNQLLEGADEETDPLKGKVALTTIYPNEQLIPAKFGGADEVEAAATLPIPEGKVAISISVEDAARVGSFIRPGAEVSVIVTQDGVYSRLLLDRVTVLAAGTTTSVPAGASSDEESEVDDEIAQLITVAVSQREAEKVRFAQTVGELSVALLNDKSDVKPDDGVNNQNLFE